MQHKQLAGCVGAVDIVADGVEGDAGGAAAGMNRRRLRTGAGGGCGGDAYDRSRGCRNRCVLNIKRIRNSRYDEFGRERQTPGSCRRGAVIRERAFTRLHFLQCGRRAQRTVHGFDAIERQHGDFNRAIAVLLDVHFANGADALGLTAHAEETAARRHLD